VIDRASKALKPWYDAIGEKARRNDINQEFGDVVDKVHKPYYFVRTVPKIHDQKTA